MPPLACLIRRHRAASGSKYDTVTEMAIQVHDYHSDLTNIQVQPQIRSRFRRVELGPVPAVRAVGDTTGVIYLSVSPHVEPTHTLYDADGERLPPRYGTWRAAGGGAPTSELPAAALVERYLSAARVLANLAQANLERVSSSNAIPPGDASVSAVKSTVDGLWETLRPVLEHVEELERAWNDLALRAAD